jgi:SAM-dependent methyltransferase
MTVFDAYATYYDLLYQDKDYAGEAHYVADLLSKNGVPAGAKLLDLGCGTGRHAVEFARVGYRVHGLDSSPAMVNIANACKTSELPDRLLFEVGDVKTVRLNEQFDAVISLFHVASYQTTNNDLSAMFETAAAHLKPGGVFVFDCWYGPAVLTDRPTVRIKRMRNQHVEVLRIAEPEIQPNQNIVEVHYTVQVRRNGDDRVTHFQENHRMRYLFVPEIQEFLRFANMGAPEITRWLSDSVPGLESWYVTVVSRRLFSDSSRVSFKNQYRRPPGDQEPPS